MVTKRGAQRPTGQIAKLLVGALVALLVFGALTYWRNARNDPDAAIDRLADDPRFGQAFTTFQREFPDDYAAFKEQVKTAVRTNRDPEAAYGQTMAFMQRWVAGKQPLIARADGQALAALVAEQNRTLKHLRTSDVRECATFGMNGRMSSPDLKDRELQALAASGMERTLLAIKSGERAAGAVGPMTEADHRTFLAALERRIPDPAKLAMLTGGQLTSASPEVQCEVTIAMTDAIGDLPLPLRGKVARSIIVG